MEGNRGSILLLEDDAALSALVSSMLESDGYAVSAFAAVDDARRSDLGSYDLLMLDMHLQGAGGLALLWEVRSGSDVPVMMASSDGSAAVTALECGADDFVLKPFSEWELLSRVHVMDRRFFAR